MYSNVANPIIINCFSLECQAGKLSLRKIITNFILAPKDRKIVYKTLLDTSESSSSYRKFCSQCFATLLSQPKELLATTLHFSHSKIPIPPGLVDETIAQLILSCPFNFPPPLRSNYITSILTQIFEEECESWPSVWPTLLGSIFSKHVDLVEQCLDQFVIGKINDSESHETQITGFTYLLKIFDDRRLQRAVIRYLNIDHVHRLGTLFKLQITVSGRVETTSYKLEPARVICMCLEDNNSAAEILHDCLAHIFKFKYDVQDVVTCLNLVTEKMKNSTDVICSLLESIIEAYGIAVTANRVCETEVKLIELLNHIIACYLPNIFVEDTSKIIRFIKVCLSSLCCPTSEEFEYIRGSIALSVLDLTAVLFQNGVDKSLWAVVDSLVPSLRKVEEEWGNVNPRVQKGAANIISFIESRGEQGFEEECETKLDSVNSGGGFEEAFEDACSLVCVVSRGHGIQELTRLIMKRDSQTMENEGKILKLLIASLSDEDSFVYLAAIRGLVELCDRFHEEIVPLLVVEFAGINSQMASTEVRLELGEVIVNICCRLGPLLPVYKKSLLNILLVACRDREEIIRASALSSVGEFVKAAKFGIMTHLVEIVELVKSSMLEKSGDVKRASVALLVLLLQGIEDGEFVSLLGNSIGDIARIIRVAADDYRDPALQMQAQVAVAELERCVMHYFK